MDINIIVGSIFLLFCLFCLIFLILSDYRIKQTSLLMLFFGLIGMGMLISGISENNKNKAVEQAYKNSLRGHNIYRLEIHDKLIIDSIYKEVIIQDTLLILK